jgi:thymidylate kinase
MMIALSGCVGAGKSSAAKAIVQSLRAAGCQAEHVRFQEFTRLRPAAPRTEATGSGADADSGRVDEKRWVGYTKRRLTTEIMAGYVLRTLVFRSRLKRWPKGAVLVFDRYFYDSLVHFDLEHAGLPLKLLMKAIPQPSIGALLSVQEATLLKRRSRYSAEYAREVVKGYEQVAEIFPGLTIVRTDQFEAVNDMAGRIVTDVLRRIEQRTDGKA